MSYNPKNPRPLIETTNLISNYSTKLRVSLSFPENSPYTKQEFKDECDINILMNQYMNTGEMPNINERAPQYLDVSGIEFQESMQFVAGAQTLFNELPSILRNRFNNDPSLFLDFVHNPANRQEMAELGLLKPVNEWVNPTPSFTNKTPPDVMSGVSEPNPTTTTSSSSQSQPAPSEKS
ncbi:MAG: internal scaffolding protein [Microviridae sp.]|nr:MAG: internal scaffolding protein [Microviridae sp.]